MQRQPKSLLVTGGAGFIGSAFIRYVLQHVSYCAKVVNVDLLTYAADLQNLKEVESDPRYVFAQGNICDESLVEALCKEHQVEAIVHFAAESHVDRSIEDPAGFYQTNVGGTIHLLNVVRRNPGIHFHHISTDEVYGSLGSVGCFCESSPYRPNSPYAASKAASDHFVRSYANTYQISTTISHCSNNYGPGQHREKFIPTILLSCLHKRPIPIYGKGINVRDWIYVEDHVEAVLQILEKGKKGEVYDIGEGVEMSNIDLLHLIIEEYAKAFQEDAATLRSLITYVPDRPGHDYRYAIDGSKIGRELGWSARFDFVEGLAKTMQWMCGSLAEKVRG